MRSTVARVLAVDEGIKAFAETAVAVSETEFESFFRVMQWWIDRLTVVGLQIFHDKIEQAIARLKSLAVIDEFETGVEIAVMAQTTLDMLGAELGLFEDGWVRFKLNQRAIGLGVLALFFVFEFALFEESFDELPFAMAAD